MNLKTHSTTMLPRAMLPGAMFLGACATMGCAVTAQADTLPRPSVDFALTGKAAEQKSSLKIAHSNGKVRLDISVEGVPGAMTGFVDSRRRKMVMLTNLPGMSPMAIEMDLPDEYAFVDTPVEGTRLGTDQVAGEVCDIWRSTDKVASEPVDACITADGIVLRTAATINGRPQVVFEAVEVLRAPQDPALFELPKGVKVTRIPKGMQGMMPNLPGLGR